ncbi:BMP family ABC transporter substrate-binding protein [Salipaludibacillus neizhouensis]|uniref:BMP family ABC transporter substrate-binding protein n=1 Tax=Salipaludibacillus neizhouensis TaxID=885475 RepID=A0A3A9KDQ5_9BACI|nr:BMP family ABC transporter substrate-binding protein [Salipaludibacillus neizhouensis]RKL65595.1 BMP family ABC transporter substrate-binding protein [Salipaludibacillus neizhouensis]
MKKRVMMLMSSVLAAGTLLAACGEENNESTPINDGGNNANEAADNSADENTGNNEAAGEGEAFTAQMVTDIGGVDDRSFNESAWAGLTLFGEDYPNAEVGYVQSSDASDYAPNLNRIAREGTDISFAIGFLMEDDIKTVAAQNEDQNFAIVDTVVTDDNGDLIPNIANITFAEHEGSFLVGAVAAMQSETDHIGFIGGVEGELIKKFESGFKAGAKFVNPDIEIATQYAQNFNDASKGQQIGNAMYGNGADIIFHAAGATGNGLITDAIERAQDGENVWVIGVDQDQALTQGDWDDGNVILTSMVKRVDEAVYQVAESTMNGEYPGGEVLEFTLEDAGVGIAESRENVSEEALTAVEEYTDMIINGEIVVPKTDEEYEEFEGSL